MPYPPTKCKDNFELLLNIIKIPLKIRKGKRFQYENISTKERKRAGAIKEQRIVTK